MKIKTGLIQREVSPSMFGDIEFVFAHIHAEDVESYVRIRFHGGSDGTPLQAFISAFRLNFDLNAECDEIDAAVAAFEPIALLLQNQKLMKKAVQRKAARELAYEASVAIDGILTDMISAAIVEARAQSAQQLDAGIAAFNESLDKATGTSGAEIREAWAGLGKVRDEPQR